MNNKYPRVTEIIGKVIAKSDALIHWIINKEKAGVDTNKMLQKSAEIGTNLHLMVQKFLLKEKVDIPPDYEFSVIKLLDHFGTIPQTEVHVVCDNPIQSFQGHIDYYYCKDNKSIISDLKTGKYLLVNGYPQPKMEHILQLHGYKFAYDIINNTSVSNLELIYFKKDSLTIFPVQYQEGVWESVLRLYKFLYG